MDRLLGSLRKLFAESVASGSRQQLEQLLVELQDVEGASQPAPKLACWQTYINLVLWAQGVLE